MYIHVYVVDFRVHGYQKRSQMIRYMRETVIVILLRNPDYEGDQVRGEGE